MQGRAPEPSERLLVARCESEFPRSFTEHLHTQSAAHSRLDAEAPRDRNARQALARASPRVAMAVFKLRVLKALGLAVGGRLRNPVARKPHSRRGSYGSWGLL
jgi:hypothetical protein